MMTASPTASVMAAGVPVRLIPSGALEDQRVLLSGQIQQDFLRCDRIRDALAHQITMAVSGRRGKSHPLAYEAQCQRILLCS